MPDPAPRFLTIGKAAAFLKIHPNTLRFWADEGKIACLVTLGGHRRFPYEALVAAKATYRDER